MNLDTTTTRTRFRIPTEQEREEAAARQKAIRTEFEKPIAQYQRGLLTAEEFLESLVGAFSRGCEQAEIAKWN